MIRAWHEGVRFVEQVVKVPVREAVDVVVTSCAGYPLDTTWYQAVKGLTGALPIMKRGGTIVLAASMSEGIGSPEFQQRIDDSPYMHRFSTADRTVAALKKRRAGEAFHGQTAVLHGQKAVAELSCEMDEWQLVMLAKVLARCRVKVVSDGVAAETLRRCNVEPAATVEQAVAECLEEYGPAARVAVIPKGPYVLPFVA
jgi:nickel-dependent lactate racemase